MAETLSNVTHKLENKMNQFDAREGSEGEITRRIENQTSKIPSVTFLNLALGSMVLSAGLGIFSRNTSTANFVGLWAPSFLLLGIYNKLVKLEGNDRYSKDQSHQSAA